MVHIFHPLDLTVNGHCKKYMKVKPTEWDSQQVANTFHASERWKTLIFETHNNQAIACETGGRVL